MTNKLKSISRKSILKFNKTIKNVEHLKKTSVTEKELFFKTHEYKYLFEDILNEFESEKLKSEYSSYSEEQRKEFVWNHHMIQKKNSFYSMKIDFKSKNITKDLYNLYQTLTLNCLCVIKNFDKSHGLKKLLHLLDKCIRTKCKDTEIIVLILKCLKSFGNNHFGILRLYEEDAVCEILCKLISTRYNEEIIIALDLLSVICLINENASHKIILCFTKFNERPGCRFKPLIVCLMNRSKIDVQKSVMYFINTLLHSTYKKKEEGAALRLQLRKELYNLGFESYLEYFQESSDKILSHQANIFLNKSYIDMEEFDFDFLKLQTRLTTLSLCENEWNKMIHDEKFKESSMINFMHLITFLFKKDKNNIDEIILYLKNKLKVTCNFNQEKLLDQFQMIHLNESGGHLQIKDEINQVNGAIKFPQNPLNQNKSFSSLSDMGSINSELLQSFISVSDLNKDSGLSQNYDRNHSSLFSICETESCSNSFLFEEAEVFEKSTSEKSLNPQLNHTNKDNFPALFIKNSDSFHLGENVAFSHFHKENKNIHSQNVEICQNNILSIPEKDSSCSISLKSFQNTLKPAQSHVAILNKKISNLNEEKPMLCNEITKYTSSSPKFIPKSKIVVLSHPPLPNSTIFDEDIQINKVPILPPVTLPPPPPPLAPPPPPPPPMLNNINRPVTKLSNPAADSLKRINVTLIPETCLNEKSVWLQLNKKQLSTDKIIGKLVDRFSSKKAKEFKAKVVKPLIVMDSKSAQNFEIFLRSVNLKNEEIVNAIRKMNIKVITLDMIGKLVAYIPDISQLVKLEPFKNKIEELRICEQFIVHLMEIDNYKIRFNGIHLQILISNDCMKEVENNLDLIYSSFEKLLSSDRFKSVLEMILFITQSMNPEKKVVGITMDSLVKFIDTKDNCNGNLLEFLIEQLRELIPDSLKVWDDLDTIDSASRISSDIINSVVNQFSTVLQSVQHDIDNIDCADLRSEITATVELAKNLLSHISFLQNELDSKYQHVCDYFGISKSNYSFEKLFSDLKLFKYQFKNCEQIIYERDKLNEIHKQKIESINKIQIQQVQQSDQLALILSSLDEDKKMKSIFKQSAFIENAIIGISSGKIFCDDDAVLNWNVQYHRRENHKNRIKNARNIRRQNFNNLTPSRSRKLDFTQTITPEAI